MTSAYEMTEIILCAAWCDESSDFMAASDLCISRGTKCPCLYISRLLKAILNFAVKMCCSFHTFMVLRLGTVNLLSLGLAKVSFGRECNSSSLVLSRSSVAH